MAAQDRLTTAKLKADKLEGFEIPELTIGYLLTSLSKVTRHQVQIDEKTRTWQKDNPWFNTDEEMTSFALGLHNKLVKEGVDPQTDDYYERINTRMREVFPDNFEDEPEVRRRSNNVVAPATRSTAPKKIRLTQTQLTLAKRLGLTPEQYAKQVALDMRKQ